MWTLIFAAVTATSGPACPTDFERRVVVTSPSLSPAAVSKLESAANAGQVAAMRKLGLRYLYSSGGSQALMKGEALLRGAAMRGDYEAQIELGEAIGLGVRFRSQRSADEVQGLMWLLKAQKSRPRAERAAVMIDVLTARMTRAQVEEARRSLTELERAPHE